MIHHTTECLGVKRISTVGEELIPEGLGHRTWFAHHLLRIQAKTPA